MRELVLIAFEILMAYLSIRYDVRIEMLILVTGILCAGYLSGLGK